MRTQRTIVGLMAAASLAIAATAYAETAADSFAKGEKALSKGDFQTALQSYAAAARADRTNQDYTQRYAIVRRVVDLRNRLGAEKKQQQWETMARALRAFYVNERIYSELLILDEAVHAKLNSAESAAFLAETQLAMDQNAAAVQTLSTLEPAKATPMAQLLLGIALVRTGKTEEAKQMVEKVKLPADAGSTVTYTAARLHAATGDSAKAMALLKACFEGTLPSQLDGFKSHAKTCSEFTAVASTPEFAVVLKTESKTPESKCSGGSSCAGCPMRGKCPKSQAQQ
jgi:tetratricopeptide (TPR) repeat protein